MVSTIIPIDILYANLICEFSHYDQCLTGLAQINGQYWFAEMLGDHHGGRYQITRIEMTDECKEYLADYRATYHHWFHDCGKRPPYDGRPLELMREKWGKRNPFEEQITPPPVSPQSR